MKNLGEELLFILVVLTYATTAQAGGLDRSFINESGQFVSVGSIQSNDSAFSLESRVPKGLCDFKTEDVCIPYEVYFGEDATTQEAFTYMAAIQNALDTWATDSNLGIEFVYQGESETGEIPYVEDLNEVDGIAKDFYGNKIIEGPFLISFVPPSEIPFTSAVLAKSKKYIALPDPLEGPTVMGETLWGGVFLNPNYDAYQGCTTTCYLGLATSSGYDLRKVIAHEIGKILGLATTALKGGVMYPFVGVSSSSSRLPLSTDDSLWAETYYPNESSVKARGSLRGSVKNGNTGAGLSGAHLLLVAESQAIDFSKKLDPSLATVSSFSREGGSFEFLNVPAGRYYLLMEAIAPQLYEAQALDLWLQALSSPTEIEPEFYDGAVRESNQEPLASFSPQSIAYAALLVVPENGVVSGIQMITNVLDPSVKKLTASGSTNEVLSKYVASDQLSLIQSELETENAIQVPEKKLEGGCSLHLKEKKTFSTALFICFLFFLLTWSLVRELFVQSHRLQDR